jgi:hypothetical protein
MLTTSCRWEDVQEQQHHRRDKGFDFSGVTFELVPVAATAAAGSTHAHHHDARAKHGRRRAHTAGRTTKASLPQRHHRRTGFASMTMAADGGADTKAAASKAKHR